MMLVPYNRRNNSMSVFDPFREFDALERAFFGRRDMTEFRTDITDNGNEYSLQADLPGFNKEDIHIDLDDAVLTITAERHSEFEQKDRKGDYVRCERSYGTYSRSFDTTGVDTENIKATYENGVLRLTLPKLAEPEKKTRRLTID
ncbi:MAG: Hsp20/alpha crystallin family protein [Clostridia bacterium]|nr:Hsp20/alpha crystallin family protein [Clostridia bacterium]